MEKVTDRSQFLRELKSKGITNLELCYECSMCSGGCPVAYAMDYYPHQIIHMIRLGQKKRVLQSKAIWLCTSCYVCATRCPNGIDIVNVMDALRQTAMREGLTTNADGIPKFHRIFMDEVRKRGRINELRLLFRYKLITGDFFSFRRLLEDAKLGLKMFSLGKLKLISERLPDQKQIKKIFTSSRK